jgi:hypothetical protein
VHKASPSFGEEESGMSNKEIVAEQIILVSVKAERHESDSSPVYSTGFAMVIEVEG